VKEAKLIVDKMNNENIKYIKILLSDPSVVQRWRKNMQKIYALFPLIFVLIVFVRVGLAFYKDPLGLKQGDLFLIILETDSLTITNSETRVS
jgi:hypothetical protein